MKRILFILLVAVTLLSSGITADAKDAYRLIGDVDEDGIVSILDATHIQRALANMSQLNALQRYLADADGDMLTDIVDVTVIQQKLAEISDDFYCDRLECWKAKVYDIEPPEGVLSVNTPLTFRAVTDSHPVPDEFRVSVDGVLIKERSPGATFSHTFTAAGKHDVWVQMYDPFGGMTAFHKVFLIVNPSQDKPQITSLEYSKSDASVTVSAAGGKPPYQYSYIVRHVDPPPPGPTYSAQFEFMVDENGIWYLYCDFCNEDAVQIPLYLLSDTLQYEVEVQVMDSNGMQSEIRSVKIVK